MAKAKKLKSGNYRVLVPDYKDENGKWHYKSFTAKTKKEAEYMAMKFSHNRQRSSASYDDLTLKEAYERYIGINPGIIDDHFKKCRKNSELPYFKFHSLRHYFASELHAQGIPDKYIAEIGGWENVETLQRIYQHTLKDHADELTKKILNVFAYSNSKNKSDCNSKSEKQA